MRGTQRAAGFTIVELLIVLVVVTILASLALPTLARARGDSMVEESMNNLIALSVAHVMYAADWNGRQLTFVVDDISTYGSVGNYNDSHGCDPNMPQGDGCHPPVIAGWCEGGLWAYWPAYPGHYWVVEPLGFPESSNGVEGFGNFRIANAKQLHDYVNGRFYESTYYAPADTVPYELTAPLFDDPCEFSLDGNPPYWTSYALSPAGMLHPDVMRSNAEGGWQDPWDIPLGHESPGYFQARYPDLKTHMIEHHWLQGPPADCNPSNGGSPFAPTYNGCEPYYFNHGIDSSPAALFYDGHVRLLPNTEVFAADQMVLKQTGGIDGLWHRGTSFGEDGYFIPYGYDGAPLSHHILTTDGILGRDTLGGMPSIALNPSTFQFRRPPPRPPDTSPAVQSNSFDFTLVTAEGDQP